MTAIRPSHRHRVYGVIFSQGARLTISENPQITGVIEDEVVRRGDGAHLALVEPGVEGALVGWLAAEHEDAPGEVG